MHSLRNPLLPYDSYMTGHSQHSLIVLFGLICGQSGRLKEIIMARVPHFTAFKVLKKKRNEKVKTNSQTFNYTTILDR